VRYGIFSDIHSNLEALEAVIKAYGREGIDTYFCGGDIVGYGSDLHECIEKTGQIASVIVAGNHDWAAVDQFSSDYFNSFARQALLWTKERLNPREKSFLESLKFVYENEDLTLVHGTLDNPQDFDYMLDSLTAEETFKLMQAAVCFVGHSHVPGIFIRDKHSQIHYPEELSVEVRPKHSYIVNVGSVGQPRDGDPRAAYCVYDTAKRQIQVKRVEYDAEAAREKIIRAGLPEYLGNRLLAGK